MRKLGLLRKVLMFDTVERNIRKRIMEQKDWRFGPKLGCKKIGRPIAPEYCSKGLASFGRQDGRAYHFQRLGQ